MAQSTLTIPLSAPLLEALKLPPGNAVDYFSIMGLVRGAPSDAEVDRALLERSKVLRQWQNSPQYGGEVVKLLPQLHRAAKILKDPARRSAYLGELERSERGEEESATDEFAALARVALADGPADLAARKMLSDFAAQHGIPTSDAQRILGEVRQEMDAQRAAAAAELAAHPDVEAKQGEEEWEFRIGGEGEEAFEFLMMGLEANNKFTDATPARLVGDAGKYALTVTRAKEMIEVFQRRRYRDMVRRVAGGGAVRDNQIPLLASKAPAYGIDQKEAYELISEYTLTAHSAEDMFEAFAAAETFGQADINSIIEEKAEGAGPRRVPFSVRLRAMVPDWARNLVLIVIGGAVLLLGGIWARDKYGSGAAPKTSPVVVSQSTPSPATPAPGGTNNGAPTTPQTPAAATPTPPTAASVQLITKPDPPSGVLTFAPIQAGDPVAFEMAITEVTNAQFDSFLQATLTPAGSWKLTPGTEEEPATGMAWTLANQYCAWQAQQRGWENKSTRLPTQAEYLRAVRGRTTRGATDEAGYWDKAHLGQIARPATIKNTQWDKVFVAGGNGQIYDLIGNVAEWGSEEQGGKRAVLGGDYTQKDAAFDPLKTRWQAPDQGSPSIGFRFVHIQ